MANIKSKNKSSSNLIKRETHIIDAKNQVLGRLASKISVLLRGKHKECFVPNKDVGDFVIVENIDRILVTGKKMDNKIYYRHTGYLGGLKQKTFRELFKQNPEQVLKKAVFGMLPKNRLRPKQIKRLKIK